jgi:hypothetical protein
MFLHCILDIKFALFFSSGAQLVVVYLTIGCAAGGVLFQARKFSHSAASGRHSMSAPITGCCSPNSRGPHTLAARAATANAEALALIPSIGGASLYSSCHAAVALLPVTARPPSGVTLCGQQAQFRPIVVSCFTPVCVISQITSLPVEDCMLC